MTDYFIEELLPHSGKMLLLENVLDWGDDWLKASVKIAEDSMFVENGQLDALVVIEYMAQAIAAFAGIRSKNSDEAVRIGLLLGTRKLTTNVSYIAAGTELVVYIKEMFNEENGLGVFNCVAKAEGILIECNLNVYHPNDIGVLTGE